MLALPTSLYFLWSPLTDFFVRRRSWLLAGGMFAAGLMLFCFERPKLTSTGAMVLMFLSACCSQLVVSSTGGIMGAPRSAGMRRMAGSFYQAGVLGFGALSASLLVYLSSRVSRHVLGLTAAALIGLPALAAFAAPLQQEISTSEFRVTMRRIGGEFKATFLRWDALPYIACMTFPFASGAAVGLLPGVAVQYGVDGDHVAWVNGLLGAFLMAAGETIESRIIAMQLAIHSPLAPGVSHRP